MLKPVVGSLLLLIIHSAAIAQIKARNYQECLLNATREGIVSTQRDVGQIKLACEQQFPDSVPNLLGKVLPETARNEIDIWLRWDENNNLQGRIYNGNSTQIITQIELLLIPTEGDDAVENFFSAEEYQITVKVLPAKTGEFTIAADATKLSGDLRTQLIRAWGY